ncbi:type 2A phosphatase activator TIP41 [Acrasis kona]|uniref:Type 2A phosphatase activator TIP41 n=1 Tax=Acrasis kona TaxID=1008807 RepID=A0AAW2YK25_9EUKA
MQRPTVPTRIPGSTPIPNMFGPEKTFNILQWSVTSHRTPILSQTRTEEYSTLLDVFSLPEMLFDSKLYVENKETGFKLEFNALDGLKNAKTDVLQNEGVSGVKVGCAWDTKNINAAFQDGTKTIEERDDNIDWTFTTLYKGSMSIKGSENQPVIEDTTEGVDYERLKRRDPILFYDELVLYEDELHDHGTGQLSVKTRFMGEYAYILLRFFLRVDGVVVRVIDNRFYTDYSKDYWLRETSYLESSYDDLAKKSVNVKEPTLMADPNQLLPKLNCKIKKTVKIYVK